MELTETDKMKNKETPDSEVSWNQSSPDELDIEIGAELEEITILDNHLNQLEYKLSKIEEKNEKLQQDLTKLLEANKEARREFQEAEKYKDNPTCGVDIDLEFHESIEFK